MILMNECEKIQQLLSDFRTGAVNADESKKIEAHIANCPECASELKALDDVLDLLKSNVAEYEPPVGLWNGVYNELTSPQRRERAIWAGIRDWFAKPVRAVGVGAVAVVIVVGIMFNIVMQDRKPAAQYAASSEYVQGHALYASQAPLADQVAYLSIATSSESSGK